LTKGPEQRKTWGGLEKKKELPGNYYAKAGRVGPDTTGRLERKSKAIEEKKKKKKKKLVKIFEKSLKKEREPGRNGVRPKKKKIGGKEGKEAGKRKLWGHGKPDGSRRR